MSNDEGRSWPDAPVVDTTVPRPARIYNALLGDKDNFEADRVAAERIMAVVPDIELLARQNRAFLGRAVRYLVGECGIRQIIDIGSGLPTQGNVHEVAHRLAPETRVVYVDNDPIVSAHGRALLATNNSAVITADLRDPDTLLRDPELLRLIDPGQPVGLLMVAIVHFIADEEGPGGLLSAYRSWLPAGSHLVISHVNTIPQALAAAEVYEAATAPFVPRPRDAVAAFFGDFELAAPGLVSAPAWRPSRDDVDRRDVGDDDQVAVWAGVGRKITADGDE